MDALRSQTHKETATYDYKPEGKKQRVVVSRGSTKKAQATILDDDLAGKLKKVHNSSPQAWRDALLMCLLLDHGLRASEVAILKARDISLSRSEMRFFRPKVKGTSQEWTTHKMTPRMAEVASYYLEHLYPLPYAPRVFSFLVQHGC